MFVHLFPSKMYVYHSATGCDRFWTNMRLLNVPLLKFFVRTYKLENLDKN